MLYLHYICHLKGLIVLVFLNCLGDLFHGSIAKRINECKALDIGELLKNNRSSFHTWSHGLLRDEASILVDNEFQAHFYIF